MQNNLFQLIKVQESIELPDSKDCDTKKYLEGPQPSHYWPSSLSSSRNLSGFRPFSSQFPLSKSKFSLQPVSQLCSIENLPVIEENINEGNIQRMLELRLVKINYPFPVIDPLGRFTKGWNCIIVFVMLYISTIYPVRLGFFDDDFDWTIMDILVDSIFMFDMVVNFLTAFEDLNGLIVFNPIRIALNYLKSWFLLDLISSLPVTLMFQGSDDIGEMTTTPTVYRLTKVTRFFRLFKMARYYEKILINFKVSKQTIAVSKMIISTLFLLHIIACLWILIAKIEDNPDTWIVRYQLINEDKFTLYITSIYYILFILFTIGYGNITASTSPEKLFTSVFMFFGIGFFGFLMGTLNQIFQKGLNLSEEKELFFLQLAKDLKISQKTLAKILIRNGKLNISDPASKISSLRKQEIFKDLPNSLQNSLNNFIYKELLDKIEFFHDKPFSLLIQILPHLTPIFLKKGDEVFREGDIANEVYFILRGRVVSRCLDNNESTKTVIFIAGGYFGEADIIYKRQRHETAFAESDAEIWKLDKKYFLDVLTSFEDVMLEVRRLTTEKFKFRKASAFQLKMIPKYLLPATYFISKLKTSKKKNRMQWLIRKSGGVLDERKKLEAKAQEMKDLRNLFLKNDSMKVRDKDNIFETTQEDIEELGFNEVMHFLFQKHLYLMEEDLKRIEKLPETLKKKKERMKKRNKNRKPEKLDEFLELLKSLDGILSSQEEELREKMKGMCV